MIDIKEIKEKSAFMQINGRDLLRGLAVAALAGALTIVTSVDNVLDFGKAEIWLDVANSAWKSIGAYLVLNFLSKK
jgi:hypothetical protein